MDNKFNFLFRYLEKEKIYVDKSEFLFQIQSHPNYPSVLSIIDTLDFFGIENGMIKVDLFEINLLPNRFVVLLENKNNETRLYLIEKEENKLIIYDENNKQKIITRDEIKEKWSGIILLVEKSNEEKSIQNNKKSKQVFSVSLILLFIIILLLSDSYFKIKFLYIFISLGIIFSFATAKELFDSKSELFNKFCNLTESTSCSSVVNSDKWKIFKILNLSDLSIIFFTFQFFFLFYSMLSKNEESFVQIIFYILLLACPLFFTSIYFQKNVEKKWCPLCLVIIIVSISELIYLYKIINFNNSIPLVLIIPFTFIFLIIYSLWNSLKEILIEKNELKEFKKKGLKFQRNYQIFKNTLIANKLHALPQTPIIIGNKNSKTIITLITNPFCGYCQNVHEIIDKILLTNGENIQVHFIIKVNLENENDQRKKFYISIINNYLLNGEISFKNSFKDWFNEKDINSWLLKYESRNINSQYIDSLYLDQNNWCKQNNFNYTPSIFINGYEYPEQFERENLEFFIKEVIEDRF